MKKFITVLLSLHLSLIPLTGFAECAKCKYYAGFGLAMTPESDCKNASTADISGRVISVETVDRKHDIVEGVYLLVKKNDDTMVPVRLCPESYLSARGLNISPSDEVTIEGYLVKNDQDKECLIAKWIEKNGQRLAMRDKSGRSLWSQR